MRQLQNISRSNSGDETPSDIGGFGSPDDKGFFQDQIKKANSVPISTILGYYGIKIDNGYNQKIICPFSERHKKGRDNSPSFNIYVNTNSFWCFGCKIGSCNVDFVANMESIGRFQAAQKILAAYGGEVNGDFGFEEINYSEHLDLLVEFSNYIREFIIANIEDENAMKFIDEVCGALDNLHEKYGNKLRNDALRVLIDRLKTKVSEYK